jgi:hypothetical protein
MGFKMHTSRGFLKTPTQYKTLPTMEAPNNSNILTLYKSILLGPSRREVMLLCSILRPPYVKKTAK